MINAYGHERSEQLLQFLIKLDNNFSDQRLRASKVGADCFKFRFKKAWLVINAYGHQRSEQYCHPWFEISLCKVINAYGHRRSEQLVSLADVKSVKIVINAYGHQRSEQ